MTTILVTPAFIRKAKELIHKRLNQLPMGDPNHKRQFKTIYVCDDDAFVCMQEYELLDGSLGYRPIMVLGGDEVRRS